MSIPRPLRVLLLTGAAVPLAVLGVGSAAAQDDSSTTTETTQLDLDQQDDGSTTTTPEQTGSDDSTTSTTQLVLGDAQTAPVAGTDSQPPTRVDAGAGGSAAGSDLPLASAALAGGLVILTGAAALKMRREQQA